MKIEKINDFQIRCTLTAEDLKQNKLALTDIAFCSDKARSLFRDMIQHAAENYGFELPHSASLMVEVKATSSEDLILTITRIKDAEDMRRYMSSLNLSGLGGSIGSFTDNAEAGTNKAYMEKYKSLFEKVMQNPDPSEAKGFDGVRSFRFDSLDDVISASKAAGPGFSGINSLYRFGNGSNYQLLVHYEEEYADEFAKICETLSEYGLSLACTAATENYLKEHGGLIIENNALQQLAYL